MREDAEASGLKALGDEFKEHAVLKDPATEGDGVQWRGALGTAPEAFGHMDNALSQAPVKPGRDDLSMHAGPKIAQQSAPHVARIQVGQVAGGELGDGKYVGRIGGLEAFRSH